MKSRMIRYDRTNRVMERASTAPMESTAVRLDASRAAAPFSVDDGVMLELVTFVGVRMGVFPTVEVCWKSNIYCVPLDSA